MPSSSLSLKPLARLVPLVRPYRTRLAVAFVFLVIAAAAGLVFPAVMQFLLDAAFEKRDRGALDRIAVILLAVFAVQAIELGVVHATPVTLLKPKRPGFARTSLTRPNTFTGITPTPSCDRPAESAPL